MRDPQLLERNGDTMTLTRGISTSSYANGSAKGYPNGGPKLRILSWKLQVNMEESRKQDPDDESERVTHQEELEVEQQMERERQNRWVNGEAR